MGGIAQPLPPMTHRTIRTGLAGGLLSLVLVFTAHAQSGTTARYNVDAQGLALEGYDPVSYFSDAGPQAGVAEHAAMYQGVIYTFASDANKQQFLNDPERYIPQFGGWCAYGFAMLPGSVEGWNPGTYKVDPTTYLIEDGKLYLFYNAEGFDASAYWRQNPTANLAQATAFWHDNILNQALTPEHNASAGMNPNAPPETAELDWFIGEWEVIWKQKSKPHSEVYDLVTKATWRVRYAFDGFAVVDEFTGPNHAAPTPWGDFRGMTVRAYDRNQQQWIMTYQHINGSDAWRLTGAMENGEFKIEAHDFAGQFQYRPHFFDITADSFTWTNDVSVDGGETWIENIARAEAKRIR